MFKNKQKKHVNKQHEEFGYFFKKSMWKDLFRKVILIIGDLEASEISETGMFFHR